ncbi:MAG: ester cyclase [Pseudomonadota bacterium]
MSSIKTLLTSGAFGLVMLGSVAHADDLSAVRIFYDLLSDPGSAELTEAFLKNSKDTWESIGDYSGVNESRDAFVAQMSGFAQLIPDLNWSVQAMHQDGAFVTVRSRATGTPVAPLFGAGGQGQSFDIMTIDIHEIEDGKIARSYHVEDWAGALRQLSSE